MQRPTPSALRITATALAAALAMAGCADDGSPDAGAEPEAETFNFVVDTGFTGPQAAVAASVLLGLETAADQINAEGGIDGRQIVITKLDDGLDPTKAVSELQDYLSSGKTPDLVYAGISSSETLALLPLLTQKKILSISQTQSGLINDPAKYPYHFGANPTNLDRGAVFGPQWVKDGVKKLAAVLPSDAFGDDIETMLTAVTSENGIELNVERFDATAIDYSSSFQRALTTEPDALYIEGTGDASAGLFAARLKVGATDVPTYGGFGIPTVPPASIAEAAALTDCQFPVYAYTVEGGLSGAPAEALEPLAEAVAGQDASIFVPGLTYDALRIVAKAAEDGGGSDTETLLKALSSLTIEADYLITKPSGLTFNDESHFPGPPSEGDQIFIPCDATISDGFWQF